ncbi:MAG: UvrD-helicase domain-containing protein, partial [Bacteriovoracaceae bacterium]|nr:UvrD-helicase domain-containing protein [Bacteriovoracaceae bacterium]
KGIELKEISPYSLLAYISEIKNRGFYKNHPLRLGLTDTAPDAMDELYPYYEEYEAELLKSNAIDFGGLIVSVIELFEKFPQVLERYQKRFKYILVDEYQDTNRAQFILVELLSRGSGNICVVGDEDQSIYSWRGADIRNILDFEKIYPNATFIKLEQNYRSTKNIISAATHLISHNEKRKGKEMWTDNTTGEKIKLVECYNEKKEADFVAEKILELKDKGNSLKEMALFYRSNAQSRQLEDALRKCNIAYRVVGGIKFYERKEIKDALSYLRVLINSKDSLAFSRIINIPARGIGATTFKKFEEEAVRLQISLYEVVEAIVQRPEEFTFLKLGAKIRTALSALITVIQEAKLLVQKGEKPSRLTEKLLQESGYMEFLRASRDYEALARIENIEEFMNSIRQFEAEAELPTLSYFLETITLDTTGQEENFGAEVSLMTVHSSKGLEFEYVFLVGAEESIFPSYQSLEVGESAIEEERRLFYVAMTRAMKELFICYASSRMLFGTVRFNGPSRFVHEIPEIYCAFEKVKNDDFYSADSKGYHVVYDEHSQRNAWESSEKVYYKSSVNLKTDFPVGVRVKHSLYGYGKVMEAEGSGEEEKIVVRFDGGVRKKFLVKFAPITVAS